MTYPLRETKRLMRIARELGGPAIGIEHVLTYAYGRVREYDVRLTDGDRTARVRVSNAPSVYDDEGMNVIAALYRPNPQTRGVRGQTAPATDAIPALVAWLGIDDSAATQFRSEIEDRSERGRNAQDVHLGRIAADLAATLHDSPDAANRVIDRRAVREHGCTREALSARVAATLVDQHGVLAAAAGYPGQLGIDIMTQCIERVGDDLARSIHQCTDGSWNALQSFVHDAMTDFPLAVRCRQADVLQRALGRDDTLARGRAITRSARALRLSNRAQLAALAAWLAPGARAAGHHLWDTVSTLQGALQDAGAFPAEPLTPFRCSSEIIEAIEAIVHDGVVELRYDSVGAAATSG